MMENNEIQEIYENQKLTILLKEVLPTEDEVPVELADYIIAIINNLMNEKQVTHEDVNEVYMNR